MSSFRIVFLALLIAVAAASCKRMVRTGSVLRQKEVAVHDTILNKQASQLKEEERFDSLQLLVTLKYIQDFSSSKIADGEASFINEFELPESDSTVRSIIRLAYGNLFASSAKHLMVRQILPSGVYWNVFTYTNRQFIPLLSHKEWLIGFVGDTIEDVNGDSAKDFLVQTYPSAGCCLRNIFSVYLYQSGQNVFSGPYEFINPTFSAKEKIVRGIGYGHPGDVELYKYKWSGLHVDTVEFIYHNIDDTLHNSFYRTDRRIFEENVIKRGIKEVPAEYRRITDFDWFGQ